jgi:hypothetical protein
MLKKIIFVILWTAILPVCTTVGTAFLAGLYSWGIIFITGSRPSDVARHMMANIWTYSGMIMTPVALLLGVLGMLPGTRLSQKGGAANDT